MIGYNESLKVIKLRPTGHTQNNPFDILFGNCFKITRFSLIIHIIDVEIARKRKNCHEYHQNPLPRNVIPIHEDLTEAWPLPGTG
jgi:hypothetical protein